MSDRPSFHHFLGATFYHRTDVYSRGVCVGFIQRGTVPLYLIEWSEGGFDNRWYSKMEIAVVYPPDL